MKHILMMMVIALPLLTSCKSIPPGHDPHGPGNSENAPGHNKNGDGPGNSGKVSGHNKKKQY